MLSEGSQKPFAVQLSGDPSVGLFSYVVTAWNFLHRMKTLIGAALKARLPVCLLLVQKSGHICQRESRYVNGPYALVMQLFQLFFFNSVGHEVNFLGVNFVNF